MAKKKPAVPNIFRFKFWDEPLLLALVAMSWFITKLMQVLKETFSQSNCSLGVWSFLLIPWWKKQNLSQLQSNVSIYIENNPNFEQFIEFWNSQVSHANSNTTMFRLKTLPQDTESRPRLWREKWSLLLRRSKSSIISMSRWIIFTGTFVIIQLNFCKAKKQSSKKITPNVCHNLMILAEFQGGTM